MPPAFVLSQDQTLRKNYFHHSLCSSWSFFAKKICDSSDSVQLYKFIVFYYDFSSFIQNFQNLTRAHRTIQFFKEHADKNKNTSPTKTHLFSSGLPLSPAPSGTARCVSTICYFLSDCYIELAFRELLSFVMLLNVSSFAYLSNTFFKKIQFFLKIFVQPVRSKRWISFNDIEFK